MDQAGNFFFSAHLKIQVFTFGKTGIWTMAQATSSHSTGNPAPRKPQFSSVTRPHDPATRPCLAVASPLR